MRKSSRQGEDLDAGFAIGERSGGSAREERMKWWRYSTCQAGFCGTHERVKNRTHETSGCGTRLCYA
jgi:hypothetical protein